MITNCTTKNVILIAVLMALSLAIFSVELRASQQKNPKVNVRDVEAVLGLADKTFEYVENSKKLPKHRNTLKQLHAEWNDGKLAKTEHGRFYLKVRNFRRDTIFSHPDLSFEKILINRNPPPKYSHNADQHLGMHSRPGPGLTILTDWKTTPKATAILKGKLPKGAVRNPDLHYDGEKVVFAFCDHTRPGEKRYFLYEANMDGSSVRQLTGTKRDKFKTCDDRATVLIEDNDACYLPDDNLVFISTRSQSFGRCHGTRYAPAWVLHVCDKNGDNVKQISWNNENEYEPAVLNDGRIVFTRWEYTDRNHVFFHKLWWCKPDGTSISHFFGNDIVAPMTFVETSPIPGSHKVVTTAMGHHSYNTGTIVVLDTNKGENGEECIKHLTPETPYSETQGWPKPHFSHAYPINEGMFLVSRANHRVHQQGFKRPPPNDRAIYLVDTLGGREFIYEDPAVASFSPIAIRKRKRPPVLPSIMPQTPEAYGTVFLQNAYLTRNDPDGIIKPGMIKAIRINALGVQPRNIPKKKLISPYAANNIPKKVLGTVPVNASGSAYFRVPANTALQMQILDKNGMAILTEKSFFYVQPGENRSCVGCHEPVGASPDMKTVANMQRLKPVDLTPAAGPQYPGGLSFRRTVQPVLDRYCIGCHGLGGGEDRKADAVNLLDDGRRLSLLRANRKFNLLGPKVAAQPVVLKHNVLVPAGYHEIAKRGDPYLGDEYYMGHGYYKSGRSANKPPHKECLERNISRPRRFFAYRNKVAHMLIANHANVNMDKDSYMRIIEWLDLNSQYYGDLFPNKVDDREIDPDAVAELRAYAKTVAGDQISAQPERALINPAQPDESRILMMPLAKSAGGWGQIGKWENKNDPGYKKMAKLVNNCIVRKENENTLGWKPTLEMGAGIEWVLDERKNLNEMLHGRPLEIGVGGQSRRSSDDEKKYDIIGLPDKLKGLSTVTISRGSTQDPAPGFKFRIGEDSDAYIAVHNRGGYRPPKEWKKTDMKLKWLTAETDTVYKRSFKKGEVVVPWHSGTLGSNYGVPSMAFVKSGKVEDVRKSETREKALEDVSLTNVDRLRRFKRAKQKVPTVIKNVIKALEQPEVINNEYAQALLLEGAAKEEALASVAAKAMCILHYQREFEFFNPRAIETAFAEMKQNPNYNATKYIELKNNIIASYPKVIGSVHTGSKDAFASAEKLLAMKKELLLSNPVLDFDKLVAVHYNIASVKKNAKEIMGRDVGTRISNFSSNSSQPKRGFDCELVEFTGLRGKLEKKVLFKPSKDYSVSDLRLHWDADRLMFSSIGKNGKWNVFEINMDGTNLHEVIDIGEDDLDFYEGTYLPSGEIVVSSTIGYQAVPCVTGKNQVANLCLYNPKNKALRRLNFGQDADWGPTIMNNGKIMYLRWEYTDLIHFYSRIMMQMNPDGTAKRELYGSGSMWPNAMFDAQPLPGNRTSRFVAIVSGHHGVARSGRMITFDPQKSRKSAEGVMQEFPRSKETVIPTIKDNLVDGVWPQFMRPHPINDKYFIVTAKLSPESLWGIYLIDVFDNMTPIVMVDGSAVVEALPVFKKDIPPVILPKVDLAGKEATVYIQNLYEGVGSQGLPRGKIKSLRVLAYEYLYNRGLGNHLSQGIQAGWDIKRLLGEVPVEDDGSVIFKVPANVPIALQPLDADGAALQWMRSWFTAMPGELVSCVGCHENQNTAPMLNMSIASRKEPLMPTPPAGGVRPFTFELEVQPILDKKCAACHDGNNELPDFRDNSSDANMLKKLGHRMGKSYLALHPYVHRQGPEAAMSVLYPMEYHASTSDLVKLLEKGHHNVTLSKEEWKALYNWIDFNAPYSSTFGAPDFNGKDLVERKNEKRRRFTYHYGASDPDGKNQIERRKELMKKYNNVCVDWQKEIKDYEKYLDANKGGAPAYHNFDNPAEVVLTPSRKRDKPVFPAKENVKHKNAKSEHFPFGLETAQAMQNELGKTTLEIDLGQGIKMKLKRIPAGEFVMGSLKGSPDEAPLSKIGISKSYWIGECEVTNEQYATVFPEHDSRFTDQQWKDHATEGYPSNKPKQPVIRVSWEEALAFCKELSKKTGLKISLPTEAQWEWAARAGSAKALWFGGLDANFAAYANLADDELKKIAVNMVKPRGPRYDWLRYFDFIPRSRGVNDKYMIAGNGGHYKPNPWGVSDMIGNVKEWTRSDYVPYPYVNDDGRNACKGDTQKVVRGGSWRDRPKNATSSFRDYYASYQKVYNVGFRIVAE